MLLESIVKACVLIIEKGSKGRPEPLHKIGMCHSVNRRWWYYQAPNSSYQPEVLFVVCRCTSRSAAACLEAALIHILSLILPRGSRNRMNGDRGAEGRKNKKTESKTHYVYMAVQKMC